MNNWCILLFMITILPLVYATDYHNCFKRVIRRSIGNYAPIAEYHGTALSMCSQHCIMAAGNGPQGATICKAFTYEVEKQLCKLYDNGGNKVPAVLHPVIGIDIFYRKSENDECSGPNIINSNPNFVKLHSDKSKSSKKSDLPTLPNDQFMQKVRALSSPLLKLDNLDEVLRSRLHGQDELVPMTAESKDSDFDEQDASLKCKTSSGYYVVVGNEIVLPISGGDVRVYNQVEQGDCAKYCSENRGPDGVLINCRSLNYIPDERKCELYAILAEPHGTGRLMENEKVIYAEKFCLPESPYECQDDEIFILHVQKTVSRRKLGTKSATSITDCLGQCLANEHCKSSVFISDTKQCDLFEIDVSTGEHVEDSMQESVLIENGCRRNGKKLKRINRPTIRTESRENEGWSDCDYKINGKRIRVRINDDGEMETDYC